MKHCIYLLIILLTAGACSRQAQKKLASSEPCSRLYLDLKKGTLDGIKGTASMEEVKKAFPCFTGETEEKQGGFNCGGGIFFLNHGFFIYTRKDYINVRTKFVGKVSEALIGKTEASALSILGQPDEKLRHDDELMEEKVNYLQYQKKWGTLVLISRNFTIQELELHYGKNIGEIDFCF